MKKIEKTTYGQLVAHCFMANGKPAYENYEKYYDEPHKCIKKSLWNDLDSDNPCA